MKALIAALALLVAGCVTTPAAIEADVLLRGGTIYPGGEAEPFVGDVAVRGERIVALGQRLQVAARRTIEAHGLVVAPGFIDPHAHVEGWLTSDDAGRRLAAPFLLQGVTTTLIGNDGFGPADVKPLLASAGERPVGINYGVFTGFGSIRGAVVGSASRAPTPPELAQQQALVRRAMCDGAVGLSTGLFYAPQSFADTAEVVALARTAAEFGGVYDTHLRDEGSYSIGLAAAVHEAIGIARAARIPVHISHIKALGVDAHGLAPAVVAQIARARGEGLAITAGLYPYDASGTSLVAALVPPWAQDGGRAALLARLADPAMKRRLTGEISENLRRRGGAGSLLLVAGRWRGQRLDGVARRLALDPVAAAIAVIREGDVAAISFAMAQRDIDVFRRQPWVMTESDASTGHPRAYGSFARTYAHYVRKTGALDLRAFVDRSSTAAAEFFKLAGRGRLAPGQFADIAVFDPVRFADRATYEAPELAATGMRQVLVNGALAVEDGRVTGAAGGRALVHRPARGCGS